MAVFYEPSRGIKKYRDLTPGEETLSAWLLRYVQEHGRTGGFGTAVGVGGESVLAPRARLVAAGYIEDLGNGQYSVTEKGSSWLEENPY